jgi:hypothetical protein
MRGISFTVGFFLAAATAWGQAGGPREMHVPKIELGSEIVRLPMGVRGGRTVVEARVER